MPWCIIFFEMISLWHWKSLSHVWHSLWPHGLYSPWNSPGQNAGVGSLSLLQRIFPTQGSNPGLPHCRWILYQLSHQGSQYRQYILIFNIKLSLSTNNFIEIIFGCIKNQPIASICDWFLDFKWKLKDSQLLTSKCKKLCINVNIHYGIVLVTFSSLEIPSTEFSPKYSITVEGISCRSAALFSSPPKMTNSRSKYHDDCSQKIAWLFYSECISIDYWEKQCVERKNKKQHTFNK